MNQKYAGEWGQENDFDSSAPILLPFRVTLFPVGLSDT
jgi:hypothetical protein